MLRFYTKFVVQRCIVCCDRRHLDKSTSDYILNTGTRGGRIFVTLVTSTPQQMYVILLIYQYLYINELQIFSRLRMHNIRDMEDRDMQRLLNHVWHLCLGSNPRGPHHLSRTDCSTASKWPLRSDRELVHGSLRMQMNQTLQALRLRNAVTHAWSGTSLASGSVATLKLFWYFQHEAQISKGFKG